MHSGYMVAYKQDKICLKQNIFWNIAWYFFSHEIIILQKCFFPPKNFQYFYLCKCWYQCLSGRSWQYLLAFKPTHRLEFLSYWLFATQWSMVFSLIGFDLAFQERMYANQTVIYYFTVFKLRKYSSWHGQSISPYSPNNNGILIKLPSFLKFLIWK